MVERLQFLFDRGWGLRNLRNLSTCLLSNPEQASRKHFQPSYFFISEFKIFPLCRTIIWNPTALCDSSKTNTCCLVQKPTTPGKLGRAVGFLKRASRLGWICNFTIAGLCRILAYCRFSYNSTSLPITIKPELGGSQIAPNRKCNLCFSAKSIFAVWDKK